MAASVVMRPRPTRLALTAAALLTITLAIAHAQTPAPPGNPREPGRFVWHNLMTRDLAQAKTFYSALFGWTFEDGKRGELPFALVRLGSDPVGGIVDVSSIADAAPLWLSFMAVADVDRSVDLVRSEGGKVIIEPRDLPNARVAAVSDPQGAPLGLAQLRRDFPERAQPTTSHFFWQEYLASDATKALEFYKRLAAYESTISDTSLGVEYHVLKKSRNRAGLFQLPPTADVKPNWLPYVLVADPAALAVRVPGLGGRILVPASPERRKGSLVVFADPGGAALALQKFPF
jgi:predicted enzyme related to lactoylglutathione lyase